MVMVLLKTFLGIILLIAGFGLAYFYLSNINNGASGLLLIPAFLIVIVGVVILARAGKSAEKVIMNQKDTPEIQHNASQNGSILQKNNEMTQEWSKSLETRDKLRLLEMTTNEEDSSS
jgi:biopolymer transport protein ExbB/TolQ